MSETFSPTAQNEPPPDTRGFRFNHTMVRIKDAAASLAFYQDVLGFRLVDRRDFPQGGFTLFFLMLSDAPLDVPDDAEARRSWLATQTGVLELTHNHGTENDPGFRHHDGNSEPKGFGHLCVSVPDIRAACERFEREGVAFRKRLSDGTMRDIAFIQDPDGYWIEVIQPRPHS
ncbi:lactoylglutathione lyase [Rhizosaccharibacter radicis]|uniref:lactoylglutathione lyase n=1 Tax=Rhizosaccharibacter radicis TaxID=2782605 RepID=A0ABT1VZZ0_9PROT|nr:lactoylglutathione lyase [Acetobacteraceae bacterium KSS12]